MKKNVIAIIFLMFLSMFIPNSYVYANGKDTNAKALEAYSKLLLSYRKLRFLYDKNAPR